MIPNVTYAPLRDSILGSSPATTNDDNITEQW